jgi:hypothetical protein
VQRDVPRGPEMDIAWLIPAPSWTIQRLIRLVRILELGPDADLEPAFGVVLLDRARAASATPLMTRITSVTRALPSGHPLACQAGKFLAA